MSEHERGAYTPQPDAPLSFDARISRERRPLPLALIASCVLLSTLIVALFLFYRSGMRGPSDAPMPVGTPVEQYKSPPPAAPAPNSLSIQAGAPPEAGASGLAPAAEQPVKRALAPEPGAPVATTAQNPPAAPAPVQTQPAPVVAQPVAQAPAPVKTAPAPVPAKVAAAPSLAKVPEARATVAKAAPAKAVVAKAKPLPKDVSDLLADDAPAITPKASPAKTAPAKTVSAKTAAAKPAATPAASKGGGIVVQIGAYLNEAQANDAWQKVAGLMGGSISGKGRHVEPVSANGSTRYRSQVTGFASRSDAVTFCTTLKSRKHDCIVKSGD